MDEVIEYLAMKNHYYEKFYQVTTKFLDCAARNEWDDMAFYVDSRERILSIIRSYDYRISQKMQDAEVSEKILDTYRPRVKALFDRRKEIADKIVALDLELIAAIDDFKTETIRDLKKTVETQQQLDSFARHEVQPKRKIAKA